MSKLMDKYRVSEYYYILVIIGYFLTMLFDGMRPGVFATLLMMVIAVELFFRKEFIIQSLADKLVVMYFAYLCLSVIWLLAGRFPVSVFIEEFTASVFPMIFYFVGKGAKDNCGKWYKNYLIAMLIVGILGVILYVWAPQFYNDWCFKWNHTSKPDAQTTRVRMNSAVGSTCLSFICVAGMLVASFFLGGKKSDEKQLTENKDKGFGKHYGRFVFAIVSLVLCLLFSILANQRSGLVAAFLVIIYINYLMFFQLNIIKKKYFLYEVIAIVVVFVLVCVVKFDFVLKFWYRIISLPTAISERSEQWIAAVNNMYSTWLGNGLGANGHKALYIEGAHVIADGGLVKLYCEDGVLGFSMFIFLIIEVFKKGLKNMSTYYVEVGIVSIAILQSIGSNMLAFQLCTPIFWFAIGRICSGRDQKE